MVKNDHLGTAEDLQDRQEYIPLENSFDIFPYVKVSLIFLNIWKYLQAKMDLKNI